jgi:hypothetical protein
MIRTSMKHRPGRMRVNIIAAIVALCVSAVGIHHFVAAAEAHEEGTGASGASGIAAHAEMKTEPGIPTAGRTAVLTFHITDPQGRPVRLSVMHDRLMHVVVVSRDFNIFAHIHPEDSGPITDKMKESATFPVHYTFPKAGEYLVAVDYVVKGNHFSNHFIVNVSGRHHMGQLKKDLSREKNFGDYHVTLSTSPVHIRAGEATSLKYFIEKGGNPVTDLEPYLSAPMHIAIVLSDLNHFIHAHGRVPGMSEKHHTDQPVGHIHGMTHGKFGPYVEAHVVFPAKGLYKIFGQIKHRGKIILTQFMVEVE